MLLPEGKSGGRGGGVGILPGLTGVGVSAGATESGSGVGGGGILGPGDNGVFLPFEPSRLPVLLPLPLPVPLSVPAPVSCPLPACVPVPLVPRDPLRSVPEMLWIYWAYVGRAVRAISLFFKIRSTVVINLLPIVDSEGSP